MPGTRDDAEVIVIGAGAVGLTVAIRLARQGVRTLLLEAGPPLPPADYAASNAGRSIGRAHGGVHKGRMRALGGTTRLWGGQLVPFGAHDIDGPTLDAPAWPLRYEKLAPAIDAAFTFLGVGADARDGEAVWARATGTPASVGETLTMGLNIWLRQPDFTRLFADDLASLSQLTVRTDSPVTRLRFAAAGRIDGVETGGEASRSFRAAQVVLAAGTLENARLLLMTAATELRCGFAGNQHLGQGYIDHLHGLAGRIHVADRRRFRALFDHIYFDGRKYGVKMRASDGFRARAGIANCAGTINTPMRVGTLMRDMAVLGQRLIGRPGQASTGATVRQAAALGRILLPLAFRYLWQRRATTLLGGGVWLGLELEQIANPRSFLRLDPDVAPQAAEIQLHWALDGREVETAAAFAEAVDAAFAAEGIGHIEIDPRLRARDPAFLDTMHDGNHQMGGTRMAASADAGVVDRDCRVFGTQNLHVAGASVFPTGSFANPTLTAIALGLRLADRLSTRSAAGAAA